MGVGITVQGPHAFMSTFQYRTRLHGNSLISPVVPPSNVVAPGARTKRGTRVPDYAENDYDDDDIFEDSEQRRATGLRSRREDPAAGKDAAANKPGRELHRPVEVQGIWRDWMGKARNTRSDRQRFAQTALPMTLIPIRIDVDIQPFVPPPPLPQPPRYMETDDRVNYNSPLYRSPEATTALRLKDFFLWNLHETLITPDQFAANLVYDLDLPVATGLIQEISKQIRSQLEEYGGVALHPLFHSTDTGVATSGTVGRSVAPSNSREQSNTPVLTPQTNGRASRGSPSKVNGHNDDVTASATMIPNTPHANEPLDPDDTYRCIVSLNVNLQNKLYTDKFEWSLLHPLGFAEAFAKQTCSDVGISGEWVPAISHAIYEAVLRLKKEACESGGLVGSINGFAGEIDNSAASATGSGWRYDHETLGVEWEPSLEILSKEEIEKKEGDRERQLRRLRRETARFSSTANMMGGVPEQRQVEEEPQVLGRGERSKKKRRFRSLSPQGRATPEGGAAGYGGGGLSVLNDWERQTWRCSHCLVYGSGVWGVRDGPYGPRSLCNNCGLVFERDKRLPPWSRVLHYGPTVR